jgi:hypothetical protein
MRMLDEASGQSWSRKAPATCVVYRELARNSLYRNEPDARWHGFGGNTVMGKLGAVGPARAPAFNQDGT